MNKFTFWFIFAVFFAFLFIGIKYLGVTNYELDKEHRKQAVLDGKIVSQIEDIVININDLKKVKKTTNLKKFYYENNKENQKDGENDNKQKEEINKESLNTLNPGE